VHALPGEQISHADHSTEPAIFSGSVLLSNLVPQGPRAKRRRDQLETVYLWQRLQPGGASTVVWITWTWNPEIDRDREGEGEEGGGNTTQTPGLSFLP